MCSSLIFVLLSTFTVLNMLVGILCEVVSVISAVETEQLKVQQVVEKLARVIDEENIDSDHDEMLNRDEFEILLTQPDAVRAIADIDVDVVALIDMTDFIYADIDHLSQPQVMDNILNLRGTNGATVKDLVDLRRFLMQEIMDLEEEVLNGVEDAMEKNMDKTLKKCLKKEIVPVMRAVMAEFQDRQQTPFMGSFPMGGLGSKPTTANKDGRAFGLRGRNPSAERLRSPSP